MATVPYPGEPLESDQIRLIRLRSGQWADAIICELYNTRQINDDGEAVQYPRCPTYGAPGASLDRSSWQSAHTRSHPILNVRFDTVGITTLTA